MFQESLLLEPMFEVPGSTITGVRINEDYVHGNGGPVYIRTTPTPATEASDEEDMTTSIRLKQ